jgi:hypothetical protein
MMMSTMASGCAMNGQTAVGGCAQNCCSRSLPQAFVPFQAARELHPSAIASHSALSFLAPPAEHGLTVGLAVDARAASPPPYLRNQVFRI